MSYREFIESKVLPEVKRGWTIDRSELHPSNLPHQADVIEWAAAGGRRAIFASFGMGKTQMQLELARLALYNYSKRFKIWRALIICPLGVKQEFKNDAKRLGIEIEYCRTTEEAEKSTCSIIVTNYERVRDGSFNPDLFDFVSLDEASALRSLGSKTYIEFTKKFELTAIKFVATATPSPNDYIELLNYAAFLGIMDIGQAKTRFFKRDSTKADELTLHPHKEREFWLWVSSWAIFLNKPSDLGYSDEGYDLPELEVHWTMIDGKPNDGTPDVKKGQVKAFKDQAADLSSASRVKRESAEDRVMAALEIMKTKSVKDHWLIWHHLENERKLIENMIPDATTVFGAQPDETKEKLLTGFSQGKFKILATKPEIAGQGCNFQKHCHLAIFLGVNYKFNEFIQAIHRIQRFQQKHGCHIWVIFTEEEQHIVQVLLQKWERHKQQMAIMRDIIKAYGLSHSTVAETKRSITIERKSISTKNYHAVQNDCVMELKKFVENSIHLYVSSFPFAIQYEYSPNYHDFGHNETNEKFFEQLDFLLPEIHRTLMPGRIAALHVKDRIEFGNFTGLGMPTVYEFSDDVVRAMKKHKFAYMGRIVIPTDVVRENSQTYRLGWSENAKDGTKMGVGMPEYILLFRKLPTDLSNAYADLPVQKSKDDYSRARWQIDAHALWKTSGNRLLTPAEYAKLNLDTAMHDLKVELATTEYNFERHVEIAEAMEAADKLPTSFMAVEPVTLHPDVWSDITRMRGLNTMQGQRKEQQHLCPLPFDIVNRLIERYSNPGEVVADPFAGVFTVPYCAVKLGRKGLGVELNPDYFNTGLGYMRELEHKNNVKTLFDVA